MKAACLIIVILSVLVGFTQAANPEVTLQITGGVTGTIVIELFPEEAPVTVANFVEYVQSGYYDGLIFHRVIEDFMIQGGGFDQDLVKQDTNPAIINESSNRLSNLRGTITMARTYYADSATSEFFINHQDNSFLDYGSLTYTNQYAITAQVGYCVFGQVISGMDVIDAIAIVPVETVVIDADTSYENVPVTDVIIQSATMTVNAPVCVEKLAGDVNGDCHVNLADFAEMADNWLLCNAINLDCDTSMIE